MEGHSDNAVFWTMGTCVRLDMWAGYVAASCGQGLQLCRLKYELCYPSRGVEFVCDIRPSELIKRSRELPF